MGQSLSIDVAADRVAHFPGDKYRALLEVSRISASHENLSELFHDLAGQLHGLLNFRYLSVVLHDPVRNVMRLHTLETCAPKLEPGTEFSMDESPSAWVWQHQQPLIIVNPADMLAELHSDNKQLASALRAMHELCEQHGDVATASLIENLD